MNRIFSKLPSRPLRRVLPTCHHSTLAEPLPPPIASERMNTVAAISSALNQTLATNPDSLIFGEDVKFGGVFRCTQSLAESFPNRVFNTPLSEQGILGFAIGLAAMQKTPIAEIQFADYIFPAFDQLVNEAAKMRYRSGGTFSCGGLVVRAPCGGVGHGGHYHSQSPEAYLCHTPGLRVVTCRGGYTAKGLLLKAIEVDDPVIFLEPKILYRSVVEEVPTDSYTLELEADIVRKGRDVTLVGWGGMIRVLEQAADKVPEVSCEIIDVQSLLPWDVSTIIDSAVKTGRVIVAHEAPHTNGLGAEIAATVQSEAFLSLTAPVKRVAGVDAPVSCRHEHISLPDSDRVVAAIHETLEY